LGFAGSNGRAYTPIGRVLIARHALLPEAVTMQSIRAWLVAHPDQVKSVLDANDRYVFLRLVDDESGAPGPVGALGVDLVPGRAAAVDPHFTPLGSLMVLDTTDPLSRAPWRVLVLAQDLGSDIAGPARVDLFVGAGDAAAARAGAMRQGGTVYLLLPRPPAGKPVG
jgi:membrane-bound lytic murein transglycosylase A